MKVDIKTRDFLHKLVTDYLVSLEGNLGYRSENTVRAAKSDLGRFLDYASTKENALAQKILTENFVLDYIAQLKKKNAQLKKQYLTTKKKQLTEPRTDDSTSLEKIMKIKNRNLTKT